jgi:hypothetical protein
VTAFVFSSPMCDRALVMGLTHRELALAVAAATCVLAGTVPSRAEGADDHATASAIVLKLEQEGRDTSIIATAVGRAKEALQRAAQLRRAGDEAHAKASDGLAREWAETARDLARAADAERTASELRRKAVDAQARLERSRALVEEAIARAGRLRAELEAASRPSTKGDRP